MEEPEFDKAYWTKICYEEAHEKIHNTTTSILFDLFKKSYQQAMGRYSSKVTQETLLKIALVLLLYLSFDSAPNAPKSSS